MFLHELIRPFPEYKFLPWQLGSLYEPQLDTHQTVIVTVPGIFRDDNWHPLNFSFLPEMLGEMSHGTMSLPICLLGELEMPTSPEELQNNLMQLTAKIMESNSRLLVLGGGMDAAYSLVEGINRQAKPFSFVSVSPKLALGSVNDLITEENYLAKILTNEHFSLQDFTAVGYQRHLVKPGHLEFLHASRYSTFSLGEIMGKVKEAEPRLRFVDAALVDAEVIEAGGTSLGSRAQVNGLSNREICQLMLEIGLSQQLAATGIFNLHEDLSAPLRQQLLVQMIWYWLEGINIQQQRPKSTEVETYIVMVDKEAYTFQRDVFSDQWYFGNNDQLKANLPCRKEDFELAKKGHIHSNLLK